MALAGDGHHAGDRPPVLRLAAHLDLEHLTLAYRVCESQDRPPLRPRGSAANHKVIASLSQTYEKSKPMQVLLQAFGVVVALAVVFAAWFASVIERIQF